MIIVFGFTTPSASEAPVVIYCGNSGSEAQQAIDISTFPRIERVNYPQTIPVRGWTPERAAAHADAVARTSGEDLLEAEAQKFLQGRVESQRAEIDAMREQLGELEQAKIRAEMEVVSLRNQLAETAKGISSGSVPAATEPGPADDATAGPALMVGEDGGPSLLAGEPSEAPAPRSRRR